MERKLAEFRARRQAKISVKNDQMTTEMNQQEKVDTQPETASTSDDPPTIGRVENAGDSAQTSPSKVTPASPSGFQLVSLHTLIRSSCDLPVGCLLYRC